jgi:hypothetical protein
MPASCKLGMGVGVLVSFAAIFALWAIADRGDSFATPSTAPAASAPPASNATTASGGRSTPPKQLPVVPVAMVVDAPPYEYIAGSDLPPTAQHRQYMQIGNSEA